MFGKFCVIFSVVVCVTTSQLFVFLRLVIPMLLVRVLLLVTWSQAVAAWSQVVWLRAKAMMSGPGSVMGFETLLHLPEQYLYKAAFL